MANSRKNTFPDVDSSEILSCLQIGKLLTSTLNRKEILNLIMGKISQLAEAENWSLLMMDEKTNELLFEIVVGIDQEIVKDIRIPLGTGIAGTSAQSGKIILIEDAQTDPRFFRQVDTKTGFTTRSLVCIPLKTHGKILGVIEIMNIPDIKRFRQKKLPVLSMLADYAAIAIMNSQYVEQIRRMSITDEYTGLFNARYLHDILPALLHDADRHNRKLAVAFMDVDNFKNVVDTYGHMAGSMILKEIGETITGCLEQKDILVKYGGDEYVLILPDRDKKSAVALSRKILKAIRSSTYLKTSGRGVKVTTSFGLAVYPDDARSKKNLLLLADNSMYHIKKTTKNGIGTV